MRRYPRATRLANVRTPAPLLAAAGALALAAPIVAAEPAGLLTPFEAKRHAGFVEAARAGQIELLFIGDSAVEFWLVEGRPVWAANYGGLKAANFGVQGADTSSVLWRLQNGELDGFSAKAIVLDAMWAGDTAQGASPEEIVERNAAIVAEIRKRQPQAKIVLLVVPRARSSAIEGALAERFAALADGSSVEYLDVRQAFATADGRFDAALGSGRGSALSEAGYAALASALQPTLSEALSPG